MTKKISNKIYYMYFLLTLMILSLHTIKIEAFSNASSYAININHFLNILCNMGVSTFFFLSALLFFRKKKNVDSYSTIVFDKFKTLMIPYILWNIIACPFKILKDYLELKTIKFSICEIIYKIALSEWNPVLWFLRVLFIYVLLFPIIKKITSNKLLFYLSTVLIISINLFIGPTNGYSSFIYWLPTYLIGAYLSKNTNILSNEEKKFSVKHFLAIVGLLIIWCASFYNDYCLYMMRIFSPLALWLVCDLFLIETEPRWIIKQTFFFYCTQLFVANYLFKVWILLFGKGTVSLVFGMIILPIILMVVLMLLATLFYKYFRNTYMILTGNRGVKMKKKKDLKDMKICLVGSSGGHLTHLYMLKPIWENKDRFWVTFDKIDANSLLKNEKVYHCYFPTNRNVWNLIRNTFLAIKVLHKEKPDLIISTGAAVAVPFFYLGKLRGAKTVYIEVFDRIDKPTLTGKLVYPITDKFIVQWDEMKKVYKKAINLGSIF